MRTPLTAIAALALVACGQAAAPSEADAPPGAAVATGDVTGAERTAILTALQLAPARKAKFKTNAAISSRRS